MERDRPIATNFHGERQAAAITHFCLLKCDSQGIPVVDFRKRNFRFGPFLRRINANRVCDGRANCYTVLFKWLELTFHLNRFGLVEKVSPSGNGLCRFHFSFRGHNYFQLDRVEWKPHAFSANGLQCSNSVRRDLSYGKFDWRLLLRASRGCTKQESRD